jgi:hypothetical protein
MRMMANVEASGNTHASGDLIQGWDLTNWIAIARYTALFREQASITNSYLGVQLNRYPTADIKLHLILSCSYVRWQNVRLCLVLFHNNICHEHTFTCFFSK